MSKGEVTDLLGEPDKIDNFGVLGEEWHYGYLTGGKVSFSSNEKIDSWREP